MDRMACVDIPAFPLQLLLRSHADWKGYPVAVVAEDKPQARLLWVNEKARRLRILPGDRFAAALAISSDLRADTVAPKVIEAEVRKLTHQLLDFTPEIEPALEEPGVFWLNAQGLERLYDSLGKWTEQIQAKLRDLGFHAKIAVGFTRFGTYALAKSIRNLIFIESERREIERAQKVLLERLGIEPKVREYLSKLGIRTVRDFLQLPAKGLQQRFGTQAYRLHRLAVGDLWDPLQPEAVHEPLIQHVDLEHPETDSERLLFLIKHPLDTLLRKLHSRGQALQELTIRFVLDHRSSNTEVIKTAAPTLDSAQILGLVRLRLESSELESGIVELGLKVSGVDVRQDQCALFVENPRRDLESANRALARLRAELGSDAVVKAQVVEGHLPRARYRWIPLDEAPPIKLIRQNGTRTLIRRIYERPLPLPPRPRNEPDGWFLRGIDHGPVSKFDGPYIISGGWWARSTDREYHFVKMKQGQIYWAFYDRRRRRWFLEGRVE
jgi:protein ImuB